ncbi:MAG: type II secretion system protein [bacterium]
MKKNQKKAFTLLELLISLVIVGIVSLITIPNILTQIKVFQVKEDISNIEQVLKEARSTSINKSRSIYIDFSQANIHHGADGGLVQIKQNETVLSEFYLSDDVLYNVTRSTLSNNKMGFDYRGQPIKSSGSVEGFTENNNTITISYYKDADPLVSKSLTVNPITGNIEIQ